MPVDCGLQPGEAFVHDGGGHLPVHVGGRGARTGAIFERIALGIADRIDDAERIFELRVGFAW